MDNNKIRVWEKEYGDNSSNADKQATNNNMPNKRTILIIGVASALIIALIIGLVIGLRGEEALTETTGIVDETIDYKEDDNDQTEPTEPLKLVDESNRPTFTIGENEYEIGCALGDILDDSELQIADIDVYLHYNKKALIVQSGKTRDWTLEDTE